MQMINLPTIDEIAKLEDYQLAGLSSVLSHMLLRVEEEITKRGNKPAPLVLGAQAIQSDEGFGQG